MVKGALYVSINTIRGLAMSGFHPGDKLFGQACYGSPEVCSLREHNSRQWTWSSSLSMDTTVVCVAIAHCGSTASSFRDCVLPRYIPGA